MDARYLKEGEATILRKSIEKVRIQRTPAMATLIREEIKQTAHEHAQKIAQLKTDKEAAEAMQQQIERNMKDEMERLKTQFTFKVSRIVCTQSRKV